jgi:hypothetical protein
MGVPAWTAAPPEAFSPILGSLFESYDQSAPKSPEAVINNATAAAALGRTRISKLLLEAVKPFTGKMWSVTTQKHNRILFHDVSTALFKILAKKRPFRGRKKNNHGIFPVQVFRLDGHTLYYYKREPASAVACHRFPPRL